MRHTSRKRVLNPNILKANERGVRAVLGRRDRSLLKDAVQEGLKIFLSKESSITSNPVGYAWKCGRDAARKMLRLNKLRVLRLRQALEQREPRDGSARGLHEQETTPEAVVMKMEELRLWGRFMDGLTLDERQLLLWAVEGLSMRKMGLRLSLDKNTIKARLVRVYRVWEALGLRQ
jgi:DNA-directed RNA polymerase specialized sigma24 family protein